MQNQIQEIILSKYQERRLRNAHYSLRAFAETIGISSGALTGIVRGKRKISQKMAERLSTTLQLTTFEKKTFLSAFEESKEEKKSLPGTQRHNMQTFELISRWQYFALLSVLKIQNVKWSAEKISSKMSLSEDECTQMLNNLVGLGLIEVKNGLYFRARKPLEFGDEMPSWAIKAFHAESLELARKSLYQTPMELRDHSSMTMAVNLKNLKKAKERIRQFQMDMAELLEAGNKSEVYRLNVQLFPIIKTGEDNHEK